MWMKCLKESKWSHEVSRELGVVEARQLVPLNALHYKAAAEESL